MKSMRLWSSLLLMAMPFVSQGQTPLRHDLFAQPNLSRMDLKQAAATGAEPEAEKVVKVPQLTSVISAGAASLVVLNGVVLRVNESADGYKLLRAGDRSAVFLSNGKQVVVTMTSTPLPGNVGQAKEKP